jgi:hypothetical protein
MIGHQMPLLDPALFLRSKIPKYFSQVLAQFPVQLLAATLRNENHMVLAFPLRVT